MYVCRVCVLEKRKVGRVWLSGVTVLCVCVCVCMCVCHECSLVPCDPTQLQTKYSISGGIPVLCGHPPGGSRMGEHESDHQ